MKWDIKQIRILNYGLESALSNNYLEVTILCLEPKVFNVLVEVLFYMLKKTNKTSTFSSNILDSKDCMMALKNSLIEPSLDYKKISFFASYHICNFFKLIRKMVFHAFQLKIQDHYLRVYSIFKKFYSIEST